MRWFSQQLGDVADKANGQVIMPYACGHVQGKVKRRCRVISWHCRRQRGCVVVKLLLDLAYKVGLQ
jgi:hypothetical protein